MNLFYSWNHNLKAHLVYKTRKIITIENTDHVPVTNDLIIPRYKVEMLWFMVNSDLERFLHPWKN